MSETDTIREMWEALPAGERTEIPVEWWEAMRTIAQAVALDDATEYGYSKGWWVRVHVDGTFSIGCRGNVVGPLERLQFEVWDSRAAALLAGVRAST